jgi:hypothetical protein
MRQFSVKQNQPAKAKPAAPASSKAAPERTPAAAEDALRTDVPRSGFDFGGIAVHGETPIRIQPKLTVGAPVDAFEQEVDRVADQVMRSPEPYLRSQARDAFAGQAPVPAAQVQTKSSHAGDSGGIPAPPIVHDVLRSPGQPLDAATRAYMEPRFGHDFSKVRVHTDARASASVRAVNALAYAVGSHIAFRSDKYQPAAPSGHRLLAHELAHVLQQSRGGGSAADPEARANSAAQRIMRGQFVTAGMVGSASPGLYRQLDETIPADEENEDLWKKALRSSQRSVFGGSSQNPLLPTNSSLLFAPHNKPLFPDSVGPGQSPLTIGGKSQPSRSYALKDPLSESWLSKRPINQVGLRSDQLSVQSRNKWPIGVGFGGMPNVNDQVMKQIKNAHEKTRISKDVVPVFNRIKPDPDVKVKLIGDYKNPDKSLTFDMKNVSAGIELDIMLRLMQGSRKPKVLPDAYDDTSTQGNATTQGAIGTEDVEKQDEESPIGAGTEGLHENQEGERGENFELNANEQGGENDQQGRDNKSATTMPPLRPKMRTGLERQFDELARSTAPSVFAARQPLLLPGHLNLGQLPKSNFTMFKTQEPEPHISKFFPYKPGQSSMHKSATNYGVVSQSEKITDMQNKMMEASKGPQSESSKALSNIMQAAKIARALGHAYAPDATKKIESIPSDVFHQVLPGLPEKKKRLTLNMKRRFRQLLKKPSRKKPVMPRF